MQTFVRNNAYILLAVRTKNAIYEGFILELMFQIASLFHLYYSGQGNLSQNFTFFPLYGQDKQ